MKEDLGELGDGDDDDGASIEGGGAAAAAPNEGFYEGPALPPGDFIGIEMQPGAGVPGVPGAGLQPGGYPPPDGLPMSAGPNTDAPPMSMPMTFCLFSFYLFFCVCVCVCVCLLLSFFLERCAFFFVQIYVNLYYVLFIFCQYIYKKGWTILISNHHHLQDHHLEMLFLIGMALLYQVVLVVYLVHLAAHHLNHFMKWVCNL